MYRFALMTACAVLSGAACAADGIAWTEWSAAPFERARAENKLLLVNVGMEGCHACYRMETITYADPEVIQLINQHFVPVYADAEARPDIGERYSDWAWPATVFLLPDATQVHALAGNKLPRNFVPILRALIEAHAAGTLGPDAAIDVAATAAAQTSIDRARSQVRAQVDRSLNDAGGWGRGGPGAEDGSRLRHLYLRAHMFDNPELLRLTETSARGFIALQDPVWGGAYGRVFAVGSGPGAFARVGAIPEKRSYGQANALFAYAIGYRRTGDAAFIAAARREHEFLKRWFTSRAGTFYSNQKVEPPKPLPAGMSGPDYWALPEAERLAYGVPPIDRAVYTDRNGMLISAHVAAFEAMHIPEFLDSARRAASALLAERQTAEGWIRQTAPSEEVASDPRMRPYDLREVPLLAAQAWFGTALLDLYRVTAEPRWLEAAVRIADGAVTRLEDPEAHGFLAAPPDETARFVKPRKPVEDNGTMASFVHDLAVYTRAPRFQGVAERTLRAVATPAALRAQGRVVGEIGIALEKVSASYVEFSVVGDPEDPRARALYLAARDAEHPRKVLHYEHAGRYPDRGRPSLYVCNPDRCSVPIEDPERVAAVAEGFRGPATSLQL